MNDTATIFSSVVKDGRRCHTGRRRQPTDLKEEEKIDADRRVGAFIGILPPRKGGERLTCLPRRSSRRETRQEGGYLLGRPRVSLWLRKGFEPKNERIALLGLAGSRKPATPKAAEKRDDQLEASY